MPSQRFAHRAHSPSNPEELWQRLQTDETWQTIAGADEIHNPVRDEGGNLQTYDFVATAAGTRHPGRAKVSQSEAPHRMVLEIDTRELTGTITVTLSPNESGTDVDVSLDVGSRGFLASMFFGAIAGAIGNGFPDRVERFTAG